MSWPATSMVPRSGVRMPMMHLMSTLFRNRSADDHQALPLPDGEVDPPQDMVVAEGFVHIVQLDQIVFSVRAHERLANLYLE